MLFFQKPKMVEVEDPEKLFKKALFRLFALSIGFIIMAYIITEALK